MNRHVYLGKYALKAHARAVRSPLGVAKLLHLARLRRKVRQDQMALENRREPFKFPALIVAATN